MIVLMFQSQLACKILDFDPFLVSIMTHPALMAKSQASIQNISLSFAPNKNPSGGNVPSIQTFLQEENNPVLFLSVENCLHKVGGS